MRGNSGFVPVALFRPFGAIFQLHSRRLPIAPTLWRGSQDAIMDAATWVAGKSRRRPSCEAIAAFSYDALRRL